MPKSDAVKFIGMKYMANIVSFFIRSDCSMARRDSRDIAPFTSVTEAAAIRDRNRVRLIYQLGKLASYYDARRGGISR